MFKTRRVRYKILLWGCVKIPLAHYLPKDQRSTNEESVGAVTLCMCELRRDPRAGAGPPEPLGSPAPVPGSVPQHHQGPAVRDAAQLYNKPHINF